MNSYDSQRMEDALTGAGHRKVDRIEEANLIVFNTCSIREKASEKLFSDLGRVRPLKEKATGDFLIAVTGCVAQSQHENIVRRAPQVDIILGPQDIQKIVEKVECWKNKTQEKIVATTLDANDKFMHLSNDFSHRNVSEFLTIQEGCNNFCSYCVVPYTRGREFSRSAVDIISEAKKLTALGVKEITLLGQNVNSYAGDGLDGKKWDLSRLLLELAELHNLKRLRYVTSHPKDVDIKIARAHGEIDILMPFLHLPVQSGSDMILKKMNRKYSVEEYLKRIEMLTKYRPDMAFSSDFIVGFPGETESDFEQTIELVEKVKFSQAYSFKYSSRPNTMAAGMDHQVPDHVKSERLEVLQKLLNKQQSQFDQDFVGKHLTVLFTKEGRYKNQLVGRSEYSQAVSVCANNIAIGDVVRVNVMEAVSHNLVGTLTQ